MSGRMLVAASASIALATALAIDTDSASAQGFLFPWLSKRTPSSQQNRSRPAPKKRRRATRSRARTYRTLCVRTCDGFYFPISFRVPRSRLDRDASACEQRCSGNARLFYYRNPGQKVSSAIDMEGMRYADLENAFRYRKELVRGCGCDAADLPDADQGGQ